MLIPAPAFEHPFACDATLTRLTIRLDGFSSSPPLGDAVNCRRRRDNMDRLLSGLPLLSLVP